jgi:hypothetical protein
MDIIRTQQILRGDYSKTSVNTDTLLKINIDGEQRLLPPDEINKIVNVGDRFNTERQTSSFYRILGTINPTISNPLFNLNDTQYSDKFTWQGFNYKDPANNEYRFGNPLFAENIINYLKESDGWFGYYDPNKQKPGFCLFSDMEPTRQRFSFTTDFNPFHTTGNLTDKNWELTVTYPSSMDTNHNMVNGGLLIIDSMLATVSNRAMTAFGVACQHNLVSGDIVKITGTTGYDGEHVVVRTGLDNGDLKGYYFVLDLQPTGTTASNSRMIRMFGGVESTYYFRKFRKVKTRNSDVIQQDDYEVYNLAFSQNKFTDKIQQFVFNEDIDISGLVDNLGRPLSELYLTIVKTSSNDLFSNISSGIETPFISKLNTSNTNTYLLTVPAINKIHNGGASPFISHIPLEVDVNIVATIDYLGYTYQDEFYGDLVEYNQNELKETVLAEVNHRFNTANRETNPSFTYNVNEANTDNNFNNITNTINLGPRHEGYYYKAHHLIKIREFSNYVEQGDKYTVGIPDYAISLDDGRYLWRDLLDIGFTQTGDNVLDYPFLNGCHYMYDNYCFMVKRQDPFDLWGLYYSKYPADPLGEPMTDKFITNSADDVC